jgi:hypothetical protein
VKRVTAIGAGRGHREAIAETVELLGIDGEDPEGVIEQITVTVHLILPAVCVEALREGFCELNALVTVIPS